LSFHLPFREDIFTPLFKAHDTQTHNTHHHGGRRRNRNVRFPSGNQPTVEFDHQRECLFYAINTFSSSCKESSILFPRKSFNRLASVFSHLFARDEKLTLFSLSLTLQQYTDVLLEQRDLFARIDQVRLRVFFFRKQAASEREKNKVSLTRRFVILFPIGGGLDCLS